MVEFSQRRILGKWKEGFSLDVHTLRSRFVGHDEYGHPRFDPLRSEVGELLYRLKYKSDLGCVPAIVNAVAMLMKGWNPLVEVLVPVPPSTYRAFQPVLVLAESISSQLNIPLANCVTRRRNIPQLKNVFDLDERAKLLDKLHVVDGSATRGRSILLFDDLYRSGATMNAVTTELYETGEASNVYALTVTRTRTYP